MYEAIYSRYLHDTKYKNTISTQLCYPSTTTLHNDNKKNYYYTIKMTNLTGRVTTLRSGQVIKDLGLG